MIRTCSMDGIPVAKYADPLVWIHSLPVVTLYSRSKRHRFLWPNGSREVTHANKNRNRVFTFAFAGRTSRDRFGQTVLLSLFQHRHHNSGIWFVMLFAFFGCSVYSLFIIPWSRIFWVINWERRVRLTNLAADFSFTIGWLETSQIWTIELTLIQNLLQFDSKVCERGVFLYFADS